MKGDSIWNRLSYNHKEYVMRATVDHNRCIGCGLCIVNAPGTFALKDQGGYSRSEAIEDTTKENWVRVRAAADSCPQNAIRWERPAK